MELSLCFHFFIYEILKESVLSIYLLQTFKTRIVTKALVWNMDGWITAAAKVLLLLECQQDSAHK